MHSTIDRLAFTYLTHLRYSGRPRLSVRDIAALRSLSDPGPRSASRPPVFQQTTRPAAEPPPRQTTAPAVIPSQDSWQRLEEDLKDCQACALARQGRKTIVMGEGNRQADIMLIGEGPGFDEDRLGRPFVGKSGQKLDQIMLAVGFQREELYIANVVKCRPPGNRNPEPGEISICQQFLQRQIRLVNPRFILALGKFAANFLYGESGAPRTLGSMREKILQYGDIQVVVTYHPSALLRNENLRRPVWDDVRVLRNLYDMARQEPLRFPAELKYLVAQDVE